MADSSPPFQDGGELGQMASSGHMLQAKCKSPDPLASCYEGSSDQGPALPEDLQERGPMPLKGLSEQGPMPSKDLSEQWEQALSDNAPKHGLTLPLQTPVTSANPSISPPLRPDHLASLNVSSSQPSDVASCDSENKSVVNKDAQINTLVSLQEALEEVSEPLELEPSLTSLSPVKIGIIEFNKKNQFALSETSEVVPGRSSSSTEKSVDIAEAMTENLTDCVAFPVTKVGTVDTVSPEKSNEIADSEFTTFSAAISAGEKCASVVSALTEKSPDGTETYEELLSDISLPSGKTLVDDIGQLQKCSVVDVMSPQPCLTLDTVEEPHLLKLSSSEGELVSPLDSREKPASLPIALFDHPSPLSSVSTDVICPLPSTKNSSSSVITVDTKLPYSSSQSSETDTNTPLMPSQKEKDELTQVGSESSGSQDVQEGFNIRSKKQDYVCGTQEGCELNLQANISLDEKLESGGISCVTRILDDSSVVNSDQEMQVDEPGECWNDVDSSREESAMDTLPLIVDTHTLCHDDDEHSTVISNNAVSSSHLMSSSVLSSPQSSVSNVCTMPLLETEPLQPVTIGSSLQPLEEVQEASVLDDPSFAADLALIDSSADEADSIGGLVINSVIGAADGVVDFHPDEEMETDRELTDISASAPQIVEDACDNDSNDDNGPKAKRMRFENGVSDLDNKVQGTKKVIIRVTPVKNGHGLWDSHKLQEVLLAKGSILLRLHASTDALEMFETDKDEKEVDFTGIMSDSKDEDHDQILGLANLEPDADVYDPLAIVSTHSVDHASPPHYGRPFPHNRGRSTALQPAMSRPGFRHLQSPPHPHYYMKHEVLGLPSPLEFEEPQLGTTDWSGVASNSMMSYKLQNLIDSSTVEAVPFVEQNLQQPQEREAMHVVKEMDQSDDVGSSRHNYPLSSTKSTGKHSSLKRSLILEPTSPAELLPAQKEDSDTEAKPIKKRKKRSSSASPLSTSGLQVNNITPPSSPHPGPSGNEHQLSHVSHLSTPPSPDTSQEPELVQVQPHFQGTYIRHSFKIPENVLVDPFSYICNYRLFFIKYISNVYNSYQGQFPPILRIFPEVYVLVKGNNVEGDPTVHDFNIEINIRDVTLEDITDLVNSWTDVIAVRQEKQLSQVELSGITVHGVTGFHINFMVVLHPIRLGTYVPYPNIRGKNCIFNPKGKNSSCLIECITAYLCASRGMKHYNVSRPKSEKWCREHVKIDNLDLPLSWENLPKVETLNKVSLFIYLLVKDSNRYFITLARKGHTAYRDRIVPLLLLENKHLVLIKDFNKYINNMKDNSTRLKTNIKTSPSYCHMCLMPLFSKQQFISHEERCDAEQTLELLPPDYKIKFRRHYSPHSPSHVGFYSFESLVKKTDSQSVTEIKHRAVSYSYIIIDIHGSVADKSFYCGPDAVNHFISKVNEAWKRIQARLSSYSLHMTPKSKKLYRAQTTCGFCQKVFKNPQDKYRHYNNTKKNDNFLTAYCTGCKFQCVTCYSFLNMVSYNTSNDFGIILEELALEPKRKISFQSNQEFKFMKVNIDNICLMNSQYLFKGNLPKLAEQHIKDGSSLRYTHIMIDEVSHEAKTLLLSRKQYFCNDYVSDIDCLKEEQLPPPEAFYNRLYDSHISSEDYAHAQRVYELGGCKCLGDYLQLYLKVKTGILCDVFTNWRKTLFDLYNLDITHYESLASFAWDALLMNSKVEFDAIHDHELYDLIQCNLNEGFTSVVKQYSHADNIHLNPQFNSAVGKYILYLNFNNLYFTCMMEMLPQGDIHKLSDDEKELFVQKGLENHSCKSTKGYWILCDTKQVSPRVAQETDELPLVLAHRNIQRELISKYSKRILESNRYELPKTNTKLVSSHLPQKNYLLSLDLLQLLMKLGLEVECVHAVYEFSQMKLLEEFNTNINQRIRTKRKEQYSALKLVNNAIFDKSLLNINKYTNCHELVTDKKKLLKFVRNPYLKRVTPLSQDQVICTLDMKKQVINQPTYVDFHILQTATKMLYEFWYNVVKAHYGKRAQLVYTDASSYIFTLECEDVYKELGSEPIKSFMDFSNFSKDHPLYDDSFKGVLGRLKSMTGDRLISEVVALKPQMFSMMQSDQQTGSTKDIPFHYKSAFTHEKFKNKLFSPVSDHFKSRLLPNVGEQICTSVGSKLGLSLFDDKRYVLNPHHSLAFGHPDILDKHTRPIEATQTVDVKIKQRPEHDEELEERSRPSKTIKKSDDEIDEERSQPSKTLETFDDERQERSRPSKTMETPDDEIDEVRSQPSKTLEIFDDERQERSRPNKTMEIPDDEIDEERSQPSKTLETFDDERQDRSRPSKTMETPDDEIDEERSQPSKTLETFDAERQERSRPSKTMEIPDDEIDEERSQPSKTLETFDDERQERSRPNKTMETPDDEIDEERSQPSKTLETFDDERQERSRPSKTMGTSDDEIDEHSKTIDDKRQKRSQPSKAIETFDVEKEKAISGPSETIETYDEELEERSRPSKTIKKFDDEMQEERSQPSKTLETFDDERQERSRPSKTMEIPDDEIDEERSQPSKTLETFDDERQERSRPSKTMETPDDEIDEEKSQPSKTLEIFDDERQERSRPSKTMEIPDDEIDEEKSQPSKTLETFDDERQERSRPSKTTETSDDEIDEERSQPSVTIETSDDEIVEERFQPIIYPSNMRSQWERTLAKAAFNCLFSPRQDFPGPTPP